MKTRVNSFTIILLFFMMSCSSSKTAVKVITEITQKVESKDFTINVNSANPQRMKQIFLTSEYDLRTKNDSAFAFLPYFGVAYITDYGSNDGGIKFAEPMTDYFITPNKKSTGWDIRFKVKSKQTLYDFYLNVFNNGSTIFTVSSFQRDAITFNGEVKR
jgi:hypothetical protein